MDCDTFSEWVDIKDENTNDTLFSINSCVKKNMEDDFKTEALTTKIAIKFLIEGTLKSKVCRYCLNITQGLAELDQVMNVAGTGSLYKVTLRDIVASFHPFKVTEDPNFPNKICQKCVDRALGAYIFMQQCERAERAMLNCFEDIYEKFERLDPIDRPKKRGRQKLNPNYNKLHVEYNKVIDYAEPIINIVNIGAESVTKEPPLNDFECKKCWQVLPNRESLLNHEKIHPKFMWYHCRLCGKSFPKSNLLKKHHDRVHILGKEVQSRKDSNFVCKECNHSTENYILHLQHIEKHKFKKVMKHVIEKRMDRLCTVCFNISDKMVDLQHMVCLHGGHPELMGDRTLQSILASTLPIAKSAKLKYQELYIPTNAKIMTIKKRKLNNDKCSVKSKKTNSLIFSQPPEFSIKSNITYLYKFSNPIQVTIETSNIFDTVIEKVDNLYTENAKLEGPKIVEIETAFKDNRLVTSTVNTDLDNKTTEINHNSLENICDNSFKDSNCDVNISSKYKLRSKNVIGSINDCTSVRDSKLTHDYEFAHAKSNHVVNEKDINPKDFNPNNINCDEECNKSEVSNTNVCNNNSETRKKYVSDVSWLFKDTLNSVGTKRVPCGIPTRKGTKSDCKYCWVFKNMPKCDFCNKPIERYNADTEIVNEIENNQLDIKQHVDKNPQIAAENNIWLCKICLTNNKTNRQACHCCEATRVLECNDVRITFDNNNIFNQQTENNEKASQTLKEIDLCKKELSPIETNKVIMIKESPVMDIQAVSDEKPEILSMDFEISNAVYKEIVPQPKNYSEDMDVEENLLIPINKFIMPTIVDINSNSFNIASSPMTNMPALNFNIGLSDSCKPTMRKLKRGRNIPRP